MSQLIESQQAHPEVLRALVDQYVDNHSNASNLVMTFAIEFRLLRWLGIDPWRSPGRLAAGVIHSLEALLPALILTTISGQWADAPLSSWVIVAGTWGATGMIALPLYRFAIRNLLAWLGAIVDETDLRRLVAWERRWCDHRVVAPVSGAMTLGIVLPLLLVLRRSGVTAPVGTLYMGALVLFTLAENAYCMVWAPVEARSLSTCRYSLYRLSPADSVPVRQSVRGYNQLGLLNVLLTTMASLLFLVLLPGGSRLVAPFVACLLLLELVYTGLGSVAPRLVLGQIIRSRKEEEMAALQHRLDDLLPRMQELSEAEYRKMKRLQETQNAIRDSPDNLLPLGAIVSTAGALLLSALTMVATAFAQEWVAGFLQRFVR